MGDEDEATKSKIKRLLVESAPPYVSAKAWAIGDENRGDLYFCKGENEKREVASLTKIMTAYTSIDLARKYEIPLKETVVRVSCLSVRVVGTKAKLSQGDSLTLWDLLHGLLLPSGNDAALCLADYFGEILKEHSFPEDDGKKNIAQSFIKRFVNQMNNNAKLLNLKYTSYANPHGLRNYFNKSSAGDVVKLSSWAMKLEEFRNVVKCRKYCCKCENKYGEEKVLNWKNTNKMLKKTGYTGLKTGITSSAGPCLAISIEQNEMKLIVVILSSRTMDSRWKEIKKLTNWALERLEKISKIVKEKQRKAKVIKQLTHV